MKNIAFLLLLVCVGPLSAFATSSYKFTEGEVHLISSGHSYGVYFKLTKDWHIYWKNSGDSGAAPKWNWKFDNARSLEAHWPIPQRIPVESLVNIGYSNEALFVFDIQKNDAGRDVTAQLKLEFLVCKIECIPYFAELEKKLSASNKAQKDLFPRFMFPQPAPVEWQWRVTSRESGELKTFLSLPNGSDAPWKTLELFPEDGESFAAAMGSVTPVDGGYEMTIPLQDTNKTDFSGSRFLVVVEDQDNKKQAYEISLLEKNKGNFIFVLLFAFIGGMILNFMPCVFPVLSIKAFSFLNDAEKGAPELRKSGMFYALGVIATFAALGGALLILRATGEQIGWGFQLQSPIITASMALLFFWLGLNFLGQYEMGQSLSALGSKKTAESLWGSFLTGVLATFVATPCTAPFMGTALGASLLMPSYQTLLVFIFLGMGMAFPFVLLAWHPRLIFVLPKPGAWMVKLKEFFAFPLFATTLWLLWVVSIQASLSFVFHCLGIMLLVAWAVWFLRNLRTEKIKSRLLLLAAAISFLLLHFGSRDRADLPQKSVSNWKIYDEDLVEKDRKEGKDIFIDFTAAWCITCQVNKKLVLDTQEIQEFFAINRVQIYRADWTDRNEKITKALARYGRNSLPVYVSYQKGNAKPKLLPEILTKNMIFKLFKETEK